MITTLAAFKTYAGITNTTDDSQLSALLGGISDLVERYCHRKFSHNVFSEKFDVWNTDEDTIQVRNPPIVSVVALTDDGALVTSDKYVIYNDEGIISIKDDTFISQSYTRDRFFTKGKRTVHVTYWGAYEEIPDSLSLVVHMATNRLRKRIGKEDKLSEKIGDYAYTRSNDPEGFFLPTEQVLLDMHRFIN